MAAAAAAAAAAADTEAMVLAEVTGHDSIIRGARVLFDFTYVRVVAIYYVHRYFPKDAATLSNLSAHSCLVFPDSVHSAKAYRATQ